MPQIKFIEPLHTRHRRGLAPLGPPTRYYSRFVYFLQWKLPLLFPVREWNSRVWWNYGLESRIETFRFQHWKKFRNVNVQLQTNVDLWLNEKLIDFANAMIFQKTSRTLYEKNKELHVWKIFEKKGPAIRWIFSLFPDFFVRPILNSKKKYLWIFITVSGISIFSVKLT